MTDTTKARYEEHKIKSHRFTVPRFSVIIPAYNSAEYIERGLKSIAMQSFSNYELIIVCDSCTDNTAQIARKYADHVYEVNYHQDGQTRNFGLSKATGEYVLWMDDDDWFLHEYVFEMLDSVIGRNDEDVLFFDFIWRGKGYAHQTKDQIFIACWCKCFRREFITDCRFSDEKYISDVAFHKAVLSKKPRAVFWNMPLYYYNFMRKGSMSRELKDMGVMYGEVDYKDIDKEV